MNKKYYIGLDIGTNSCGFAVTDEHYNLIKAKGKKLWGVRLFDKAETAKERRMKRTSRRRLDRKKLRISWLQDIFKNEIDKVDSKFLTRLKYSNLWEDDKRRLKNPLHSKDSLFYDKKKNSLFNDQEFYKMFPTVYHLRQHLLTTPAEDVRFLYLALHNIIKRRGNFLFESDLESERDLTDTINSGLKYFADLDEGDMPRLHIPELDKDKEIEILNLLKSKSGLRSTKAEMCKILQANDKYSKKIAEILVDGKVNLDDLFPGDAKSNFKFSFNDDDYDSVVLPELESLLSDEQLNVVDKLKEIFSAVQLKKLLGEHNYISEAMVESFDVHKSQLKTFKEFIAKYYPSKKHDMFKNDKVLKNGEIEINYPIYTGHYSTAGVKHILPTVKSRGSADFYKYVKSVLNEKPEIECDLCDFEEKRKEILKEIEQNTFLPKQRTKANAIYPNKLLIKEARKILETNATKFSFLNQKDESGLTNAEKILSILSFRIPYFVGPVGHNQNAENDFSWAQKTSNEPIKPWNLNKLVDFDQAEDAFIKRMTNKCTYLYDKDVLPKKSILLSKYDVLNELNKLTLNGNSISVELKQKIFNNLFKVCKKVSIKNLKDFLLSEGLYTKSELAELKIGGIDGSFKSDLGSYITFCDIFGKEYVEKNIDLIEKIISYCTIISDKARLEKRIARENPGFTKEQLNKIKSLSFNGWGSFSKEFLTLKFVDKNTGEITDILNQLWQTNLNLQQLLSSDELTLKDELEKVNLKTKQSLTYDDVSKLYCSPAVKRGVWQSLKVVDEIVKVLGRKPDKIFVEVTRHDEAKGDDGRKASRKSTLQKIYEQKDFKKAVEKIGIELEALASQLSQREDLQLRSEKLYLYFLQLGKSAYTGKPIDLNDIFDDKIYDVDHIIPQSKLKDDSIDNKVLVERSFNDDKGDKYPIAKYFDWITPEIKEFWKILNKNKLMSDKKYQRLIRTEELSSEELSDFIARQLVETNQTIKAVCDLLKPYLDNPRNVVYSKAHLVSDFRNKFNILKCREVNDLHHTKDAYLNIVVGNVVFSHFTNDPRNFYKIKNRKSQKTTNVKKLFDNDVENSTTGEIVWHKIDDVKKVKTTLQENASCLVSQMSYSFKNGQFYDETIYKSAKNDKSSMAKISLKGDKNNPLNDISRYGGFDSAKIAYFILIESDGKKGRIKSLLGVPILLVRKYYNSPEKDKKIFEEICLQENLQNPVLLVNKINIKSTILYNGGEYLLAGKTGKRFVLHNANQWFVDQKTSDYIRMLYQYNNFLKKKMDNFVEKDDKVIISKKTKENNRELALTRLENQHVYKSIITTLEKPQYSEFSNLKQQLSELQPKFARLNVKDQAKALIGIIKRLKTGAELADLSMIGGKSNTARQTIDRDISNKDIKLVLRSVTGIMQKTIKL